MNLQTPRGREREDGMALLIAVFVLMLVGGIAIAAINRSGEESTGSGRTRATVRDFYAADAGIELALMRIAADPPDLTAFDVAVGTGRSVRSGARTDATPQPLARAGVGLPPQGYSLNIGSGFSNELFLVRTTSFSPNGGVAELEAKLARFIAGSGGS